MENGLSKHLGEIDVKMENPDLSKGYGNTLLVNFDCMDQDEILQAFQKLNAWALQKRVETKASWIDIVTQISWAFIGGAKLWWEKLSQ